MAAAEMLHFGSGYTASQWSSAQSSAPFRPRFGLMRGREFLMKDAYSFDRDVKAAKEAYWKMYDAYRAIFSRCGLEFRPVEAATGAIGGNMSHEFQVLAE